MAKDEIHIRKSREGLFTRKAKAKGKSVQGYASEVIRRLKGKTKTEAEKTLLKQAVFAKNASKWAKKRRK
tara:strand:- start:281 stop:490 length:210 start_codon:yes stop_codon:yes gene_type:complete